MGFSVLYIAFGIVALWLLGEVLLQFKARLRWRLLAFAGFMGVVVGVYQRSVVVISLGAICFGTGQTLVTLSYKRGFSTGWALGGRPGSSRRRRAGGPRAEQPALEVTPVEEDGFPAVSPDIDSDADVLAARARAGSQELLDADDDVFQPVPMRDDSGEYPVYDGQSTYTPDPYTSGGYEGYGAHGYAGWGGEQQQPAAASYSYEPGYDQSGWGTGQQPAYGYEQGTGQGLGQGHEQQQNQSYGGQPQPTSYGYGYETQGGGDGWQGQQQYEQPQGQPYGQSQQVQQPARDDDPYGYSYPYQPEHQDQPYQPYIPHQQNQSPYEQQPYGQQPYAQGSYEPQHAEEQQEEPYGQQPQYADPYDPYRY
jgi:hypothetical protein